LVWFKSANLADFSIVATDQAPARPPPPALLISVQHGDPCGVNQVFIVRGMSQGTAKWCKGRKGFGFIRRDDGGKDAFVHISAVERAGMPAPDEGHQIAYEIAADRKTGKSSAADLRSI
jgi:CspA family cold shock protein